MGDQVPTGPMCIASQGAVMLRGYSDLSHSLLEPTAHGVQGTVTHGVAGVRYYHSHLAKEDTAICFPLNSKPWTSWAFFLERSMDPINSLEPSCT